MYLSCFLLFAGVIQSTFTRLYQSETKSFILIVFLCFMTSIFADRCVWHKSRWVGAGIVIRYCNRWTRIGIKEPVCSLQSLAFTLRVAYNTYCLHSSGIADGGIFFPPMPSSLEGPQPIQKFVTPI